MKDDLSARLRLGDPAALEEAMDRYAAYAAKIIAAYLNRTLPAEDMEEALYDVFVSLWNNREHLEGEVKPYLAAIARNTARQRLRQYRAEAPLPEDETLADTAPLPEQAAERLAAQYPGLKIAGTHDGYFKDEEAVLLEVAAAQPDLLFVCLGAPKQEKWIARFGLLTGAKMAIGLGGALDVFAGNVERAPEKWQKMGMEWAYRLSREPKRFGRMAKLPLVLVKAAGQRVTGRRRPGVL